MKGQVFQIGYLAFFLIIAPFLYFPRSKFLIINFFLLHLHNRCLKKAVHY